MAALQLSEPQSFPRIDRAIVDAILSGRLDPGARLGERSLATLFRAPRMIAREALIRPDARSNAQLSSRQGWFGIKPFFAEAQDAFQARRTLEWGYGMTP